MSGLGSWAVYITLLALSAFATQIAAAAMPFQITSPANGARLVAGQPLAITVSIASGNYPFGMAIIGTGDLGTSGMQPIVGTTGRFTLQVPRTISPDSYLLTAVAVDSSGALISSNPVSINVERADAATEMIVDPSKLAFSYIGERLPLTIMGRLSEGKLTDITRSSKLLTQSEDPAVADIRDGIVVAVGAGQTHINLRYGSSMAIMAVTVPAYMRGDLNGDGKVDQSDVNVVIDSAGQQSNGVNDARDLNGDGVIDGRDAEILRSLCTHTGCSSQ